MFLAEFSAWQLLLIAAVVLLLFGARIPDTMRNLGKGVSEFKKGIREGEGEGERSEKREESTKP